MERKAGVLPRDPNIPSPETDRLNSLEIQDLIIQSRIPAFKGKPEFIEFSKTYFEEYKQSSEGSKAITKLKLYGGKITYEDIHQYFIGGLTTNLAIAKKIDKISNYQSEEITQAFTLYFHLLVENISQISNENLPARLVIKQLIEHPNYYKPNFYNLLIDNIREDGYYNKTSIFNAILKKPRIAEKTLKNNEIIFKDIITTLLENNLSAKIDYSAIRKLVDNEGKNARNSINKEPNNRTNLIKDFETLLDKKLSPLIELMTRQTKLIEKLIENLPGTESRRNETTIPSITPRCHKDAQYILSLTHQTELEKPNDSKPTQTQPTEVNLKQEKQLKSKIVPPLLIPILSSKKPEAEKQINPELVPSRSIDSNDLTIQEKIDNIKTQKSDNSFAENWVIEYYVINYPDLTEKEIIKKLKDTEEEMVEWKHTLVNKNFIDNWILKHFIICYPDDYENRYEEAQKAYTELFVKFGLIKGFTTTNTLKNIVVYQYQNRNKTIETGIRLYSELFEKFSKEKLVNSNPSVINQYIIRNFDNPTEDLKNACQNFESLLKKTTKNPKDLFHSNNKKTELSPEKYLRLLFENYPINTINSIPKIEDAYQKLRMQYETDTFFKDYKILTLKFVAITSTEKPILGYTKLKKKLSEIIDFHEQYELEKDYVLSTYLMHPDYASTLIELKLPIELRKEYKKQVSKKNFNLKT